MQDAEADCVILSRGVQGRTWLSGFRSARVAMGNLEMGSPHGLHFTQPHQSGISNQAASVTCLSAKELNYTF